MSLPPPAERARTSVARARVAALTTYPRHAPERPVLTSVTIACGSQGCPVVLVEAGSEAAGHLLARPLATVRVSPVGGDTVTLHGAARRLAGRDPEGRLRFQVDVGAVRLGDGVPVPVDPADYRAAACDPLADEVAGVLAHLRLAHAEQLTACVRACGHDAQWTEPVDLDQHGLTVLAVGVHGVDTVRLPFPRAVPRLEALPPGLRCLLLCRCSGGASDASST